MTRFSSQALDELLGTGISQLDITPAERRLAVARYSAVARSLAEHWDTDPYDGLVYPQGSMRLGTITRNYHRDDEIDIDLVARRDQPKQSISQAELKTDTGLGLEKFVLSEPEGDPVSGRGQALLDAALLRLPPGRASGPAQPDAASGSAIIITDTELVRWQFSDPIAYADWFHTVMAKEIEEKLKVVAKRMDIAAGAGLAGEDHAAADGPGAQAAPRHLLHRRARPAAGLDHHHHARRPRLPRERRRPLRGPRRHHRPDAGLRPRRRAALHRRRTRSSPGRTSPTGGTANRNEPRRSSGGSSRPRPTSTAWPALAAASTRSISKMASLLGDRPAQEAGRSLVTRHRGKPPPGPAQLRRRNGNPDCRRSRRNTARYPGS